MTRVPYLLLLLPFSAAAAQGAAARDSGAPPPQPPDRFHEYVNDVASITAGARIVGLSIVDHISEEPEAWGDDASGLLRRFGSRAGQFTIQESVRHGLAAVMKRDTEYRPCGCRGFGRRLGYALVETFTDRGMDGRRRFSIPRIAGLYAGEYALLAWYPGRSGSEAFTDATVGLGITTVANVVREIARSSKRRDSTPE